MNKTFIIIVIVALIAVAFLYMDSSYPAYEPVVTTQDQKTDTVVSPKPVVSTKPVTKPVSTPVVSEIPRLVVSYTDQGFVPAIREVKRGEEVVFINNSSRGMRIASFQKDNLGYYSGFSQPRTVSRGESFKFTFLEEGAWNYHNLNYENDKGVVVVK